MRHQAAESLVSSRVWSSVASRASILSRPSYLYLPTVTCQHRVFFAHGHQVYCVHTHCMSACAHYLEHPCSGIDRHAAGWLSITTRSILRRSTPWPSASHGSLYLPGRRTLTRCCQSRRGRAYVYRPSPVDLKSSFECARRFEFWHILSSSL